MASEAHHSHSPRGYMRTGSLLSVLIVLSFTSLFVGVVNLSPADLFGLTSKKAQVLMISRIPRLISILLSGMSMGLCGLIMQQLSQNKFVSPTTAGTLDAARLGILISLLLFSAASPLVKMATAFCFALLGTYAFTRILERIRFKDAVFIPLVGLMFGGIINSISTFIAYRFDLIQNISSWLMGDFSMILQGRYELLYAVIPSLVLAFVYANRFTVAGMGEEVATTLGLNYRQVVNVGLAIVAFATAAVVLTVGTLPFLGLIVPNLVSIYRGDHLRKNLIATGVLGAIVVLVCDILGRVIIYPYEIPINVTLGVLGSGTFLYLIARHQRS